MKKDQFIMIWETTDFSDMNETDIREEFITPLLDVLGYSHNKIDKILREKSLSLKNKYHKIGRTKIIIDYIPKFRLKKFWIIEAKRGNDDFSDEDAFLQAHFYAIHPEIQAKYIVLINGKEIRIYDSYEAENIGDVLLKCDSDNCREHFDKIYELLSADTFLKNYYLGIIKDIKKALEVELDVSRFKNFYQDVQNIARLSEKTIQRNIYSYYKFVQNQNDNIIKKLGKKVKIETLFDLLNYPSNLSYPIEEILKRINNSDDITKRKIINKLNQYSKKPLIFSNFMISTLIIYINLLKSSNNDISTSFIKEIFDYCQIICRNNFHYWEHDPIKNIGIHLENLVTRLSRLYVFNTYLDRAIKEFNELEKTIPIEKQIDDNISLISHMIGNVEKYVCFFFEEMNKFSTLTELTNLYSYYIEFEEIVNKMPFKDYPKEDDRDLYYYELYGHRFDKCIFGTYHAVKKINPDLIHLFDDDLKEYFDISDSKLFTLLPKPPERDLKMDEKFKSLEQLKSKHLKLLIEKELKVKISSKK